ncbi:hypothetical protein H257_05332 [Aphanomyces astaci]|uniref:Uncharacterized protein n=1 Tax=Aphanomyces astaci TaxID=112090 RepID=W4GPT5_APHAT|nr:hypothetical protein H257_05332 [Aphanomyces astaci]ETV81740.1 hypothetical protein H257_05332 [Aphanomyces astaci]|eukprot:XP_009828477.1 hypothetical protein H257_05332 [Aphanomyces astaci]
MGCGRVQRRTHSRQGRRRAIGIFFCFFFFVVVVAGWLFIGVVSTKPGNVAPTAAAAAVDRTPKTAVVVHVRGQAVFGCYFGHSMLLWELCFPHHFIYSRTGYQVPTCDD